MTMLPAGPVWGRSWTSSPASRPGLAALVRTACRSLILAAVTISCVQLFAVHVHDPLEHGHAAAGEPGWLIPLVALAAAVLALLIAVVPIVGPILGRRDAGLRLRAGLNGLLWGVIVMLAVQFTGAAFATVPGGHELVGLGLGSAMAVVTSHTHRRSIGNETYRTFNLMAMLLASGSLASMSLTPTGRWWAHNFSTLGTSDDIAAMCFNGAMVLSGGGIALMSGALTRALTASRFAVRPRGLVGMRVLISLIGVSLMGVGFVPIDGATGLHDTFASSAGASFGALVVGVRWFARRMPRTLVIVSDVFLAFLAAAWVAYALLSIVNLTLFEVVAFTLVFVWLITLVVTTHRTGESAPATAATPGADAAPMGAVAPEAGASAASTWGWARGPTRGPAVVRTALPKRPFALSARLAGIPELGPRFSSIRS
jgi:hypothetical protein